MGEKQKAVGQFLEKGKKRKAGSYKASQTGAAEIARRSGGFSQREPTMEEMISRSVPEFGSKPINFGASARKRPRRIPRVT